MSYWKHGTFPHKFWYASVISAIMWLNKNCLCAITIGTNDVICRVIWRHLSFLSILNIGWRWGAGGLTALLKVSDILQETEWIKARFSSLGTITQTGIWYTLFLNSINLQNLTTLEWHPAIGSRSAFCTIPGVRSAKITSLQNIPRNN